MKIKNLVFDFGGVFFQINWERAMDAFRRLGLAEPEKILDKYHQKDFFLDLETGKISAEEYMEQLGRLCRRPLSWEEIEAAWLAFVEPVPAELLEHILSLRSKYKVYLLSNTNPFVMAWARSPRFSEAGLPLDAYCDRLYLSYLMGVAKPERAIFEQMTADAGFRPEETLFIDDSEANLAAARPLGFQTFRPLPEEGMSWIGRLQEYLKDC